MALLAGLEASAPAPSGRVMESPTAHGLPEVLPGDRFTTREALAPSALSTVVVNVAGFPFGTPVLVELATPDLRPSSTLEVSQAFGQLLWRPSGPAATELTLLFRLRR